MPLLRERNRRLFHFSTFSLLLLFLYPLCSRDFPKFSSHLLYFCNERAGHNLYSINGAPYVTEIGAANKCATNDNCAPHKVDARERRKNKQKNGLDTCYMSLVCGRKSCGPSSPPHRSSILSSCPWLNEFILHSKTVVPTGRVGATLRDTKTGCTGVGGG